LLRLKINIYFGPLQFLNIDLEPPENVRTVKTLSTIHKIMSTGYAKLTVLQYPGINASAECEQGKITPLV